MRFDDRVKCLQNVGKDDDVKFTKDKTYQANLKHNYIINDFGLPHNIGNINEQWFKDRFEVIL